MQIFKIKEDSHIFDCVYEEINWNAIGFHINDFLFALIASAFELLVIRLVH